MSERAPSVRRSGGRLPERRRKRRRRLSILITFLTVVVCGIALYGVQQEAVRISHVEVYGADASLATIATDAMQGSYLGIIPRNSTFFFPEDRIRANIVAAHSGIATISVFRSGLTGLTIKVNNRAAIARWCGSVRPTSMGSTTHTANCFVFDDRGVIFATSTETPLVNSFTVYAPLLTDHSPIIGSRLMRADQLPATFNFARQLASLGSPVSSMVITDVETSDYLVSGTRITYILGNEQNAFTALVSAKDKLNLADGSLEYVDLRFERKMYLKRKGASLAE